MSDHVRDAARGLLAGGFLTGPVATVARRHRRQLTDLFRDEFGWQINIDDHSPIRSLCQPGAAHVARGLIVRSGRRFDPQRYSLLFLVLASLEAAGSRTTLSILFEQVRERATGIDDLAFDHNQASHRRAFVHAVQAVVDLGVLDLADGSEETFAASGEGDALYRVDRARLTRLLATSKPPSLALTADAAVTDNLYTETEEGQIRRRRHRISRALVSEPVLYRSDLDDAEITYLTGQEARIRRVLADLFGLTLETRAEGWVAVDPAGTLTDQRFPAISTSRAAGLAVVDASRSRRDDDGTARWTIDELRDFVAGLGAQFGASWTLAPDDTDGVARVTADAVAVLIDMRLVDVDDDQIVVLPAAGRFALVEAEGSPTEADQLELT
jgi:uncharacterized protein (TIGR02678 family)